MGERLFAAEPRLLRELSRLASLTSLPGSSQQSWGPFSPHTPPPLPPPPRLCPALLLPTGFFNFNEVIGMTNVAKAKSAESQRLGMDFTVGRG